jgi:hypothetical protein
MGVGLAAGRFKYKNNRNPGLHPNSALDLGGDLLNIQNDFFERRRRLPGLAFPGSLECWFFGVTSSVGVRYDGCRYIRASCNQKERRPILFR